jgi:hypothetical protein
VRKKCAVKMIRGSYNFTINVQWNENFYCISWKKSDIA